MRRSTIIRSVLVLMTSFLYLSVVYSQPGQGANLRYKVVINHEEQYSIWLVDTPTSGDWADTGITGSFDKCQAYVREVWTDMRPRSVQEMELINENWYVVIVNPEEQYAIWPDELPFPENWRSTGEKGRQDDCRAYIREVWTDMRPLSLKKKIRE